MLRGEKLKIAVIGVGGIGSAFAFQFASAGDHNVTVVARPGSQRLSELRRDNGIVKNSGERAEVKITDTFDPEVKYDLVVVTLKAYQLGPVIPALRLSSAKLIQFMFNIFNPTELSQDVGTGRCAFGMPFIQSFVDREGRVHATIGAGGQKCLLETQWVVDLFSASGLPAKLESKMPLWLRSHAPMCVAFESASALAMRRGGGCSFSEAMTIGRGVRECFALIEESGGSVYPAGKVFLKQSPTMAVAALLWSLTHIKSFRELLASGVEECSAITDTIIAEAVQANSRVGLRKIEAMKPSALKT